MELWAIRHPVSLWNEFHIHQGQSRAEPGLSAQGSEQAIRIAEYLKNLELRGIWTSPLPRTMQLAEIIAANRQPPVTVFIEPDLMEVTHGVADGLHIFQIKELYPKGLKKWKARMLDDPCFPGGEPLRRVAERGVRTFYKIAQDASRNTFHAMDQRIAVVISHGILLKLVLAKLSDVPLETGWWRDIRQENGCINKLKWTGTTLLVQTTNSTEHLGDTRYTPKNEI